MSPWWIGQYDPSFVWKLQLKKWRLPISSYKKRFFTLTDDFWRRAKLVLPRMAENLCVASFVFLKFPMLAFCVPIVVSTLYFVPRKCKQQNYLLRSRCNKIETEMFFDFLVQWTSRALTIHRMRSLSDLTCSKSVYILLINKVRKVTNRIHSSNLRR